MQSDQLSNIMDSYEDTIAFPADGEIDAADLLPPEARDKLQALRLAYVEADGAAESLRAQIKTAENNIQNHARMASVQRRNYPHHTDRIDADEAGAVGTLRRRVETLREAHELHSGRAVRLSQIIKRAVRWIADYAHGARLVVVEVAPPKLGRGETIEDGVERMRRRLRELHADAKRVEKAPVPSQVVKQEARAQVARWAEVGKPNVGRAVEAGSPITFQSARIAGGSDVRTIDVIPVLAWLLRDQLVAQLDALIDEVSDDEHALTSDQRFERLDQIERDYLAVEREEVALIEQAAGAGITIQHRSDVAIEALLGIDVARPEN